MVYETLEVTKGSDSDEGVMTVTLNRPAKKNALTYQMFDDIAHVFSAVAYEDDVRAVVLTGAGGDFCSGADLTATGGGPRKHQLQFMRHVADAALAVHRCPKPTIAKVPGVAVGAGCSLALGCDLIVASTNARFSFIFARRGLAIDCGASWLLPRLVGLHKAKELVLLADMLSAQEADSFGLLNRLVAPEELDAITYDLARRLAAGPPLALRMSKQMLNHSMMVSMDQALDDEAWCQTVNIAGTEDAGEALAAFVEKRPPAFRGR